MEFGKVASPDRVEFSFPPNDPRNAAGAPVRPSLWIGAPVWACKEWVGRIYPPKTPARDFLKFYSRQFNSIELNSSFYRVPDAATVETWKKTVPQGFKFAPKFP